ncbi:MAG TPA: PQQ-binding-like beta-propeller repeat protein [Polyangiaceae bacterium]|nr:PQQ-binding-like beta-propeller repeat protein [Polyangiaceae bacterium]
MKRSVGPRFDLLGSQWFGGLSLCVALGCALSGSGCGAVFGSGANPELPVWMQRPSGSLEVVYSRGALAESRRAGEPYERGQPEIDVSGRRVFVGSSDRGLYALRAEDGTQLWRFETLGFVQCQPLYDRKEDALYFGSNDGALYRVDARDGHLRWRFMSNAEVSRRPVLSDGILYATNANDTVLAIDPNTGKLLWHQHRTPAMGMEIANYAGVTVYRGKVYTGFSDGTVLAFDAKTGEERWQPVDLSAEAEQTLGELPQQLDVDTTPVPDQIDAGAVVYVASYAGGLFALDAETGAQVWSNPGVAGATDLFLWDEPGRPATRLPDGEPAAQTETAPRKILIASSGTTGLWGIDPESGKELWRRSVPRGGVSAPVPFQGALLVTASQLGVFLISPLGGELIDGLHVAEGVSMTPAVHGNRAFVMTNGGRFLSLHVAAPKPGSRPPAAWEFKSPEG